MNIHLVGSGFLCVTMSSVLKHSLKNERQIALEKPQNHYKISQNVVRLTGPP